eukprot:358836-Chlamydomonas_euryale.AAC.5
MSTQHEASKAGGRGRNLDHIAHVAERGADSRADAVRHAGRAAHQPDHRGALLNVDRTHVAAGGLERSPDRLQVVVELCERRRVWAARIAAILLSHVCGVWGVWAGGQACVKWSWGVLLTGTVDVQRQSRPGTLL